jgi:uncharacterized membrane protein (UPF0127 family)
MQRAKVCVYNLTRECFLSLGVTVADTYFARLRGLIGRTRLRSDEGVWMVPSSGIHTVGVLFPIDLVYLDSEHQVVELIESFPPFHIAPLRMQAASVLELHTHVIFSSQTQVGDQLVIAAAEEIGARLRGMRVPSVPEVSRVAASR